MASRDLLPSRAGRAAGRLPMVVTSAAGRAARLRAKRSEKRSRDPWTQWPERRPWVSTSRELSGVSSSTAGPCLVTGFGGASDGRAQRPPVSSRRWRSRGRRRRFPVARRSQGRSPHVAPCSTVLLTPWTLARQHPAMWEGFEGHNREEGNRACARLQWAWRRGDCSSP